jgi:subfamily B ATP-binding cassette protein MsbA
MIFAFFVNTQFAILITIGGILTNFLFRTIYVNTKKASGRLTSGSNKYQGLIIQYVANFKYLKATGSMKKFSNKLLDTINYIQRNNERIGRLNAIITATREPLLVLVVCAVIFLQVTVWGSMLATILVSLLFFYRALTALVVMQTYYNTFLAVSGSMENMARFEQELRGNLDRDGNVFVKNFSSEVVLQDVDFYYAEKRILSNINLKIQKNQTIAFVGESGSGKTTLVNLLVGLMPLNNGDMYVDGINRKVLNVESYQQRIGYITQEPVIFNDTVFNNVTFWDEATEENKKKFESALKKAAIYDFVQGLPARENEMLGNSGINLSGGQRQRISIAREMYKDIDILVLDEATSALDSETEKAIQENIDSLKGTYTILIVAHRLSTIKEADCIVLLEGGQIIQKGTFAELYTSSEKFMRMVKLQEISYNHII